MTNKASTPVDQGMDEPLDMTVEGRPALLYGHTLASAVERLLAVLSEETCPHDGDALDHSLAVIGAIEVVRARLRASTPIVSTDTPTCENCGDPSVGQTRGVYACRRCICPDCTADEHCDRCKAIPSTDTQSNVADEEECACPSVQCADCPRCGGDFDWIPCRNDREALNRAAEAVNAALSTPDVADEEEAFRQAAHQICEHVDASECAAIDEIDAITAIIANVARSRTSQPVSNDVEALVNDLADMYRQRGLWPHDGSGHDILAELKRDTLRILNKSIDGKYETIREFVETVSHQCRAARAFGHEPKDVPCHACINAELASMKEKEKRDGNE